LTRPRGTLDDLISSSLPARRTPDEKLTIKRETLRELERGRLAEAAGGFVLTGLCTRTFQLPSCLPSCYCTPAP
jgi:hypothetical protein